LICKSIEVIVLEIVIAQVVSFASAIHGEEDLSTTTEALRSK
jgi:hypothetical protein